MAADSVGKPEPTPSELAPAVRIAGAGKKNAAPGDGAARAEGAPGKRARPRLFSDFDQAMAFLDGRLNVERSRLTSLDPEVFKLERMRALMQKLGDPQQTLRCVHVAGSKGKGSVVEMVAACLAGCGYTAGIYTSPHLVSTRERIRINREMISEDDLTEVLSRVAEAAASVPRTLGEATYFECMTAAALVYFAEQAVDAAVIEVGLGGRLDSTNIITPEVSALTAIQLEHTQLLGETLELIAREKAGIIKPGVTVVTIPQQTQGVLDVFREVAAAAKAPLRVVGEDIEYSCRFESSPELGPHCRICVGSPRGAYEHLAVPLKGDHQAMNCGLALAILDALRERGFETPEVGVARGLAATPSHGRMEMVSRSPRIVVDGAHNPESIAALVKSIGAHIRYDSLVVIFGCAADKSIPGMLSKIALGADKIIFTRAAGNPRAADPRELQRKFAESSCKMSQTAPTLADALTMARRAVGRDDLICVTGSFYLAGEAKKLVQAACKPAAPVVVTGGLSSPRTRAGSLVDRRGAERKTQMDSG